jgi:hypothetical protein
VKGRRDAEFTCGNRKVLMEVRKPLLVLEAHSILGDVSCFSLTLDQGRGECNQVFFVNAETGRCRYLHRLSKENQRILLFTEVVHSVLHLLLHRITKGDAFSKPLVIELVHGQRGGKNDPFRGNDRKQSDIIDPLKRYH